MKKQNFITFLTKPVSRIELIVAGVFVSPLILASVVSAATTISTNIVTEGTLSVTGTTTLMGNVGIGTTTPSTNLGIESETSGTINLTGRSGTSYLDMVSYRNSAITHGGISSGAARGSFSSPLPVNANDSLLSIRAQGWDGTSFLTPGFDASAAIDLSADENFVSSANRGGKIVFSTLQTGGNYKTGRMVINNVGQVGIGLGSAPVLVDVLHVATSTSNATTSIQIGKATQNKGSCLVMYDVTGAVKYVSIVGTSFVISATSCQ